MHNLMTNYDAWKNFTNDELNEIVESNKAQIDKAQYDWRSVYTGLKRGAYRPHEVDHYRETLELINKTRGHLAKVDWQVRSALRRRAAEFGPQLKGE